MHPLSGKRKVESKERQTIIQGENERLTLNKHTERLAKRLGIDHTVSKVGQVNHRIGRVNQKHIAFII